MSGTELTCVATSEGRQVFRELYEKFKERTSEHYVRGEISDIPLEYVGQGDGRIVLSDKSGDYLKTGRACVVKIAKSGNTDQNELEVNNWEGAGEEVRRRLLITTDFADDFAWTVMPYISTDVTDEEICELEIDFVKLGYYVHDVKRTNVAKVQDRAVLLDYGFEVQELDFNVQSKDERIYLKKWRWNQHR